MSADEVVALYDPDDVGGLVVGAAPRARVRAENLPHAATAVLLRRRTGEVFVHRRARTKDLWPGAHDCAAGGVVHAGETPLEAARRELAEELGVEGAPVAEVFTGWYRDADTHYLAHVYEAVWDGPVRFADGEVEAGWWERPEVLAERLADPAWPFVPDTRWLLGIAALPWFGRVPVEAPVTGGRWSAGETVVYRWGREGRTRSARLARVVRHDDDGLLLWVGQGWPVVGPRLADGRGLRELPLDERFTAPRVRRGAAWRGAGILMLVPPGPAAWSVWWFFGSGPDGGRTFEGWYGNLEAPQALRTTALGTRLVDSADRVLDVWVTPDRTPHWKDEDEFATVTALGTRWTAEQAAAFRADGEHVMALARAGAPPFDGRHTDFSPTRRGRRRASRRTGTSRTSPAPERRTAPPRAAGTPSGRAGGSVPRGTGRCWRRCRSSGRARCPACPG